MSGLTVEFIDEMYSVAIGEALTFGRAGDLVVDETNQFMHRVVGSFFHREGMWWLNNAARHARMRLIGNDGRLTVVPPSATESLTTSDGYILFESGVAKYRIDWRHDEPKAPEPKLPSVNATGTEPFGYVELTNDQRLLAVCLAERRLRDATDRRIPASVEVSTRLGWSLRKLDRKLDYLCQRLANAGVRGLRGGVGTEANDRRERLINHAIQNGLVTASDLPLLEENSDQSLEEGGERLGLLSRTQGKVSLARVEQQWD